MPTNHIRTKSKSNVRFGLTEPIKIKKSLSNSNKTQNKTRKFFKEKNK